MNRLRGSVPRRRFCAYGELFRTVQHSLGGFRLNVLKDRDVEIEYAYAFISRDEGRACVILRVDDNDKAIKLFGENGVKILPGSNIYTM